MVWAPSDAFVLSQTPQRNLETNLYADDTLLWVQRASYLFGKGAVLVDVSHLLVAQFFEAVTEDGAAVLVTLAAVGEALGPAVVKATVVLGGNRVRLVRGIHLACTLQR